MSRVELDQIQSELKIAIQTHQILVAKIQIQPQDMGLKSRLHSLQKEILLKSQKQKVIVQNLRKNLIEGSIDRTLVSQGPAECTDNDNEANVLQPSLTIDQPTKPSSTSPLRVPQYPSNRASDQQTDNSVHENGKTSTPSKDREKFQEGMDKKLNVSANSIEKAREVKQKLDFMACMNLVPPDSLKENCVKRSERKRKSTNNPNFAYGFELERRPKLSNFLASDYFGAKKPTKAKPLPEKYESPTSPDSVHSTPSTPDKSSYNASHLNTKENRIHDDMCHVCGTSGQLLLCDSCSHVYHLQCLSPPFPAIPPSTWACPQCQEACNKSVQSLAAVNAYIAFKQGKEEEKRKVLKRSAELLQEKTHLENRTKQLNEILARQGIRKQELIDINLKAKQSVENLKQFIETVQSS